MWKPGYEIIACLCIGAVFFAPQVSGGDPKHCDPHGLVEDCHSNERCIGQNDQTAICDCLRGYERDTVNGICTLKPSTTVAPIDPPTSRPDAKTNSSGSSVAAGLLIPAFLIALAAFIFFGARRYKWVQRFRQYQQNRYGNVLVTRDEDDDDPPIA